MPEVLRAGLLWVGSAWPELALGSQPSKRPAKVAILWPKVSSATVITHAVAGATVKAPQLTT